jgi:hypothetical protein
MRMQRMQVSNRRFGYKFGATFLAVKEYRFPAPSNCVKCVHRWKDRQCKPDVKIVE